MNDSSIYNDVLIKHNRFPSHKYSLPGAKYIHEGINPSCGDEIKIYLNTENEIVTEGSFEGSMCAVSSGTADMMLDLIKGKNREEIIELADIVFRMYEEKASEEEIAKLEETGTLKEILTSKARRKCVLFVWKTLKETI